MMAAAKTQDKAPTPVDNAAEKVDGRKLRTVRGPKGPSTRVPWSGGLAREELLRPGGTLLAMLIGRANQLGHQLGDMAKELNVTYGYISQLRSGHRKTEHISDAFADACAAYLDKPRKLVLVAAGRVRPEDDYEHPEQALQQLPAAISFIQNDGDFGAYMPPELVSADERLQLFVVKLYERAKGVHLLPGFTDPKQIAEQVAQLNNFRDALRARVEADRIAKASGARDDDE